MPPSGPHDYAVVVKCLSIHKTNDEDLRRVLTALDRPLEGFAFPSVIQVAQKGSFEKSWLMEYPWLTYRRSQNGGYCAWCVSFPGPARGVGSQHALAKTPLTNFKKALGVLASHQDSEYHDCPHGSRNFSVQHVSIQKNQTVAEQLSTHHVEKVARNQKLLRSLMASVLVCGRQGLALQG